MTHLEIWPLGQVLSLPPAWDTPTWAAAIDAALDSADDLATIEQLVEALTREGSFRDPVRIDTDVDGTQTIGNGMHRIISHVLAGIEQVRIAHDERAIEHAWQATMMLHPEELELAFDRDGVLSLAVDEDTWLEESGFSAFGNELCLDLIADRDLPAEQLAGIVADYFNHRGIAVAPDQVTITTAPGLF